MMMRTEENRHSVLLRVIGTLVGALLGALIAPIIFFVAAALDFLNGFEALQSLVSITTTVGAAFGFAYPRHALAGLPFFFPEIFDRKKPNERSTLQTTAQKECFTSTHDRFRKPQPLVASNIDSDYKQRDLFEV